MKTRGEATGAVIEMTEMATRTETEDDLENSLKGS